MRGRTPKHKTHTTMETKTITGLTEMEKQVLQSLADSMYAEFGFSDVGASDLSGDTKIEMKTIRGVIASLVKKGLVYAYDRSDNYGYVKGDSGWEPILYLCNDAQALVEDWQEDMGFKAVIG